MKKIDWTKATIDCAICDKPGKQPMIAVMKYQPAITPRGTQGIKLVTLPAHVKCAGLAGEEE